jgi:hypothetical protein
LKRSTLPLVRGRQGRVRLWPIPAAVSRSRQSHERWQETLSVSTRSTVTATWVKKVWARCQKAVTVSFFPSVRILLQAGREWSSTEVCR